MPSVQLDEEEWQKVMGILAQAPWNVANPLLMKIGEQLRTQKNIGALHVDTTEKDNSIGIRGRGKSS